MSHIPTSPIYEHEGESFMENDNLKEIPGENWEEGDVRRNSDIVPLTRDLIRLGLSRIARTLDTFEFAYSRFDCRKRNIGNIDVLATYVHLRVIDLGENKLKSCSAIAPIQNLLSLNVEGNRIELLTEIPDFPFLQALCLRRNKIGSSEGMYPNCLAYFQLAGLIMIALTNANPPRTKYECLHLYLSMQTFLDNNLEEVYGFTSDIYPWLTVLELKGNKLKSLVGLDLPQLQRIYLAKNQLKDLKGIDGCPSLTHLHARDNKISHLEGFPALERLEYVNLRGNDLRRYTQMTYLGNSLNIKTLILKGNPLATLADYKVEALAANPNVRRLDKEPVLETDLAEARRLRNGREQGHLPGIMDDPLLIANSMSVLDLEEMLAGEDDWLENAEN